MVFEALTEMPPWTRKILWVAFAVMIVAAVTRVGFAIALGDPGSLVPILPILLGGAALILALAVAGSRKSSSPHN